MKCLKCGEDDKYSLCFNCYRDMPVIAPELREIPPHHIDDPSVGFVAETQQREYMDFLEGDNEREIQALEERIKWLGN